MVPLLCSDGRQGGLQQDGPPAVAQAPPLGQAPSSPPASHPVDRALLAPAGSPDLELLHEGGAHLAPPRRHANRALSQGAEYPQPVRRGLELLGDQTGTPPGAIGRTRDVTAEATGDVSLVPTVFQRWRPAGGGPHRPPRGKPSGQSPAAPSALPRP